MDLSRIAQEKILLLVDELRLMMTNCRDEEELLQAKSMGAQAVWSKPFNLDEFLLAVREEVGA
jgi:DNA-binding response OmpR family regulator